MEQTKKTTESGTSRKSSTGEGRAGDLASIRGNSSTSERRGATSRRVTSHRVPSREERGGGQGNSRLDALRGRTTGGGRKTIGDNNARLHAEPPAPSKIELMLKDRRSTEIVEISKAKIEGVREDSTPESRFSRMEEFLSRRGKRFAEQ